MQCLFKRLIYDRIICYKRLSYSNIKGFYIINIIKCCGILPHKLRFILDQESHIFFGQNYDCYKLDFRINPLIYYELTGSWWKIPKIISVINYVKVKKFLIEYFMQLGLILVQLIRKLGLDYKNACLLVYHTKTFTPLNFYVVSWFKTCILNRIDKWSKT